MPHGGQEPADPTSPAAAAPSGPFGRRAFRNLFGDLAPGDSFKGYGLDPLDGSLAKTTRLLTDLAEAMNRPFGFSDPDNPNIPSGYTYFAQLVAHDLSFTASTMPTAGDALLNNANLRSVGLNLDTVYGGGPFDKPSSYRESKERQLPRHLLRVGLVKEALDEQTSPQDAAGFALAPDRRRQLARDLPRVACPYLLVESPPVRQPPPPPPPPARPPRIPTAPLTDVLISDPRNDDHAIIAQVLVLFHLLHNAVCAQISKPPLSIIHPRQSFATARSVTALVYRAIIRDDLMRRLLTDAVYQRYLTGSAAFIDRTDDPAMPVEFSHAAFRVGHAMVRDKYRLNAMGDPFELNQILMRNSTAEPNALPLTWDWLIHWPFFFAFEEPGGTNARLDPDLNLSRRISPHFPPALFKTALFANMTLPKRDLMRGGSAQMRSVKSLIDTIRAAAPELEGPGQMWSDDGRRKERIEQWARVRHISAADVSQLAADPPLLFFILLEAAEDQNGERLGTLGSVIVAEVIFRALAQAAHQAPISGLLAEGDATAVATTVFGEDIPNSMPKLIDWLNAHYGFHDSTAPCFATPPFGRAAPTT